MSTTDFNTRDLDAEAQNLISNSDVHIHPHILRAIGDDLERMLREYGEIETDLERLESENEELRDKLKTNTGLFCNGCGLLIEGWPNVFRCVTPGCGRIYHETCLLAHCAEDVAELTRERDRLKEDLRILTQGRFEEDCHGRKMFEWLEKQRESL